MGFNKLSDNNIQLRKEKSELGAQLGARTAEKAAVEKELEKMKSDFNVTEFGLKQRIVSTPMLQPSFRILCPLAVQPHWWWRDVTRFFICRRPARKGMPSF